mmetsp:Transcript_46456/g.132453  ORF Transcript_46456/g.132453 Transcript_46456/m.132453 type:complete len:224 (-) Transcript_46456:30-701(-)
MSVSRKHTSPVMRSRELVKYLEQDDLPTPFPPMTSSTAGSSGVAVGMSLANFSTSLCHTLCARRRSCVGAVESRALSASTSSEPTALRHNTVGQPWSERNCSTSSRSPLAASALFDCFVARSRGSADQGGAAIRRNLSDGNSTEPQTSADPRTTRTSSIPTMLSSSPLRSGSKNCGRAAPTTGSSISRLATRRCRACFDSPHGRWALHAMAAPHARKTSDARN